MDFSESVTIKLSLTLSLSPLFSSSGMTAQDIYVW